MVEIKVLEFIFAKLRSIIKGHSQIRIFQRLVLERLNDI